MVFHCPQTTRRIDDALEAASAEVERFHLELGEPLPGPGFDRVLLLGGAMGAYDVDSHPWLEPEKEWLRGLVASEVPVLGICLGSQLLADALGGQVYKVDRPEAGLVSITLTADGEADQLMAQVGPRVYALHQDSFTLPSDATLLAHSDRFPHAFRLGSALALQFHPDADLDLALAWGKEDSSILNAAAVDFDDYAQALTEAEPEVDRASRAIFTTWLRT